MEESEKASSGDLVDLPNEIQASRFVEARLKEIDALQQVCSIKGNNLCQYLLRALSVATPFGCPMNWGFLH